MRILDYIQLIWTKIFRTKRNIYIFLQFILCGFFLMFALTFKENFASLISETLSKNIGFRSFSVSVKTEENDLGKSELESLEHVVSVYSSKYDRYTVESSLKSTTADGYIDLLYGSSNILPNIVSGNSFSDEDTGVAICPAKFYPSSDAYNLFINENNFIDGNSLIDQSFEATYYSYIYKNAELQKDKKYTKSFDIIGIYNSEESMNSFNSCYISTKDMIEMTGEVDDSDGTYHNFVVIVDNIDNISSVKDQIENLGFLSVNIRSDLDGDIIRTITLFCDIIVAVILFAILILTISYLKKKMIYDSNFVAIMKACGFNSNQIIKISALEQLIINCFSYLGSLIIFILLFIVIKYLILNTYAITGFNIVLFANSFLTSFIYMVIITMFVGLYYIFKTNKKSVIKMVRSEK